MSGFGELFKRLKGNTEQSKSEENTVEKKNNKNIRIQIDGDTSLFKDEKQQIIEGAKQLLELGRCDDMEDAIITAATMFRGLKFQEVKNNEEGETIIVLKDTAIRSKDSINRDEI